MKTIALILALISALFAFTNRYEFINDIERDLIIADKWTGCVTITHSARAGRTGCFGEED